MEIRHRRRVSHYSKNSWSRSVEHLGPVRECGWVRLGWVRASSDVTELSLTGWELVAVGIVERCHKMTHRTSFRNTASYSNNSPVSKEVKLHSISKFSPSDPQAKKEASDALLDWCCFWSSGICSG